MNGQEMARKADRTNGDLGETAMNTVNAATALLGRNLERRPDKIAYVCGTHARSGPGKSDTPLNGKSATSSAQ
jgi:hypothetical protein